LRALALLSHPHGLGPTIGTRTLGLRAPRPVVLRPPAFGTVTLTLSREPPDQRRPDIVYD